MLIWVVLVAYGAVAQVIGFGAGGAVSRKSVQTWVGTFCRLLSWATASLQLVKSTLE